MSFPAVGDGFWAEVEVGGQHLRLFSEAYELGHRAVVYNMNAKQEVARHDASSLDHGKKVAEQNAADYLKYAHGIATLPPINWRMNVQTKQKQ